MTGTTTADGPALRTDLLALTSETLAALANRGLVKRAVKDVESGAAPSVATDPDRTVRGLFGDGTTASLPPGAGLDGGVCSCAAPGVCRHLVTLVLAYQRAAAPSDSATGPDRETDAEAGAGAERDLAAEPAPAVWSPAALDDDALTKAFGARPLAAARRTFEQGYGARVHHPTVDRPEPWVELPTCTVRFPVPGEIAYALTDAAAALRGEMVTLAVWAFRAAQEAAGHDTVRVGGRPAVLSAGGGLALDDAAGLADELLLSGVAHAGPVLAGAMARSGEALAGAGLHWPAGAVGELAYQLSAYASRNADYRPELVAALLTEIHARRAASSGPSVLGVRESGETRLRRVRLTSLGCRVRTGGDGAAAEVYFAHPGAGAVLVLHKRWAAADGQELTGHRLSTRRHLGTTLGRLATCNMVSENARRTAGRALTVSSAGLGATSVTPVASSWSELPDSLLVRDLAALAGAWEGRPPRLIRPRVEAESMRVVALSEVERVGYDPAEQRLDAVVRDQAGTRAVVSSTYRPACPGALDALAEALGSGATHVSGSVRLVGGEIRIDPVGVSTPAGVIVPDLAPGGGSAAPATPVGRPSDPLSAALDEAAGALAAVAHSGLRRLSVPARDRLGAAATALSRTGLAHGAALLRGFLATVSGAGAEESAGAAAWREAQLHVLVSGELLDTGSA
ncbi:hypothetical protein ABZ802_32255 [Streptomyces sp. NPDC047737]|uniref:hypothetical protein n=1 Tax=Streptomyces sp. NPDC047737 TaxID=3155740 RepID=UPI0033C48D76